MIADSCATYVNIIFDNATAYSCSTHVLGAVFFAFQIYCDFSGYSDIAIGTAKLLGIDLLRNFAFPYFSKDIVEFWRRWHISLSSWFRDYVYIPLGGSKGSIWIQSRNILIIFLLSGFWHGANWTFLIWGALNAMYFLPLLLFQKNRKYLDIVAANRYLPGIRDLFNMTIIFGLTVFAWIFFRTEDLHHATSFIEGIFSRSLFHIPQLLPINLIVLILLFVVIEWIGRKGQYGIAFVAKFKYTAAKFVFLYLLILIILIFGNYAKNKFIYFQF